MDMDCPKCHEPMAHNPIGETAIDVCPTCRGIWFDSGEIDALKEKLAPDQSWLEFEYWHRKGKFHVTTDVLYCPRCAGTAMTLIYDKVSETSLRYCAKCGGSWMTAADFADVVAALDAELDRRPLAAYLKESLVLAKEWVAGKSVSVADWKDLKTILRLFTYRFLTENPKFRGVLTGLQKSLPL
jgi:Zn-finger nucleic acid-binding protein